jgi:hypothetical protein
MNHTGEPILELRKVAEQEWVIHDYSFPANDARSLAACIHAQAEGDVEVLWLRPTPLPTRYADAPAVLTDLRRHLAGEQRGRPIPIPHFPPPHVAV